MATGNNSRTICVFCSSADGVEPAYHEAARQLGQMIGRRGDTLVWGGGRVGLMGEVARATRAAGGRIIGFIPQVLTRAEIAFHDADELIVTQTMRQRKAMMDERSDAFFILPGGFGTLEELAEMLVLRILGYHQRPMVLINTGGFYDPLLKLFDHFVDSRVAKPSHLAHLHVAPDPAAAYAVLDR